MDFDITLKDDELFIVLDGDFDIIVANALQDDLIKYKDKKLKKIFFDFNKVTHIASSGLRVIIFARERISEKIDVYVVGAKDIVLDVIQMSGIDNFVKVIDKY